MNFIEKPCSSRKVSGLMRMGGRGRIGIRQVCFVPSGQHFGCPRTSVKVVSLRTTMTWFTKNARSGCTWISASHTLLISEIIIFDFTSKQKEPFFAGTPIRLPSGIPVVAEHLPEAAYQFTFGQTLPAGARRRNDDHPCGKVKCRWPSMTLTMFCVFACHSSGSTPGTRRSTVRHNPLL